MTKFYCYLLFSLAFFSVKAQIVTIPDANFKARLLSASPGNQTAKNLAGNWSNVDTNNDGEIQVTEAQNISYLYVGGSPYCASLTGVQSFTNLETLGCGLSWLTSLDLTGLTQLKTLSMGYDQITSLDVSMCPNLETLFCYQASALSSLNISGLTHLKDITLTGSQVTTLNLSGMGELQTVDCSSNQLVQLNLQGAVALTELNCVDNDLTALDLSGLTSLIDLNCSNNPIASLDVNGLTALQYLSACYAQLSAIDIMMLPAIKTLSCYGNQMTSISVSGLPTLLSLACNDNQLTALDISGLPALTSLDCSENQIAALDVSGSPLIGTLNCSTNQISNLDVSNLDDLGSLNCAYNLLTTLDVNDHLNLSLVSCNDNQLTSLSVSGSIYLHSLSCRNNQLTTLDLSDLTSMYNLDCRNNNLQTLFMKNGAVENYPNFEGNPNIEYICADSNQIAAVQQQITEYGYTNCHVNSYCTFTPGGTFYTITGNNRYDENANGCNASDIAYPNLKFSIVAGSTNGDFICDDSGNYTYDVPAGNHTMTPVLENPSYFSVSPASAVVSFPTVASPFQQSFCIGANGSHPDLEISLLPLMPAIPGFDTTFLIVYKNKGTTTQSGTVSLGFTENLLEVASVNPTPNAQTASLLTWNFTNLAPFESHQVAVTFLLHSPMDNPPLNGGDELTYTATISSAATDETPSDNVSTLVQTLVNSFDPNDITCVEGDAITPEKVGEFVHYLVRFENTGSANAQNVVVALDLAASDFDLSTLVPIESNYGFVTRIRNGKIEFVFQNIQLPFADDSNDGHVSFKVRTKNDLVVGDTFNAQASIFFDYNFPVVTDPSVTAVQALGVRDFDFADHFRLYPNPADDRISIEALSGKRIDSVELYDVNGRQMMSCIGQTSGIDVSLLSSGIYFVKIQTDMGTSSTKFIKD